MLGRDWLPKRYPSVPIGTQRSMMLFTVVWLQGHIPVLYDQNKENASLLAFSQKVCIVPGVCNYIYLDQCFIHDMYIKHFYYWNCKIPHSIFGRTKLLVRGKKDFTKIKVLARFRLCLGYFGTWGLKVILFDRSWVELWKHYRRFWNWRCAFHLNLDHEAHPLLDMIVFWILR